MKRKIVQQQVLLFIVLLFFVSCSPAEAKKSSGGGQMPSNAGAKIGEKLSVFTSFYPMYDFVKKIGADYVEVTNLIPAGTEPHDWEPSPQDVVRLQKAAVFVIHGMGMEPWADSLVQSQGKSSQILVVASKGIEAIQGDHHHAHEGEGKGASSSVGENGNEEHAPAPTEDGEEMDPHAWLDPMLAKVEMENIKDALVQADPAHKAEYEKNYEAQVTKLTQLHEDYRSALQKTKRKDFVVSHEAFGYLARAYGLRQVGIEGLSPDTEPSPARMAQVVDFCKKNHITVIFFEELVSPKVAEAVAREAGAQTMVLNPLEGLTPSQIEQGQEYDSIMRKNLEHLLLALNQ